MKKFYTARYDDVFKNAIVNDKKVFKEFLETALNLKIEDYKLDPKELEKPNVKLKTKTLDVLVKTKDKTINLEVNNGYYTSLPTRNYAYICSVFSNSVFKGESYSKVDLHIQLNITWGLGQEKEIVTKYMMQDIENNIVYCDKLKIIEINMDKIMHEWYNGDKKKALKYKYYLMLDLKKEELKEVSKGDKMMEKYRENVERLNSDPEFIEVVSPEKDAEMVYNTLREEAMEEGLKEGIKEGLEQGIEQGIKQGVKQGIEQGIEKGKLETAKKLLENNVELSIISVSTGIPIEKLTKLKSEE